MKYNISFDLDFQRNPYKGLYIVLEGVNASGKTTQVDRLKTHFAKLGKTVITTSEPNDHLPVGKLIREIINGTDALPKSIILQHLYTADRLINHETIVIPALRRGDIVISSRNFWSALVYGVLDKGSGTYKHADTNLLLVSQSILSMYHQFLLPDYTFFLDVSLDTVMQRIAHMHKAKDIYEKREKLRQLIAGYQWIAKQFVQEIRKVDGERQEEVICEEILSVISQKKKRL